MIPSVAKPVRSFLSAPAFFAPFAFALLELVVESGCCLLRPLELAFGVVESGWLLFALLVIAERALGWKNRNADSFANAWFSSSSSFIQQAAGRLNMWDLSSAEIFSLSSPLNFRFLQRVMGVEGEKQFHSWFFHYYFENKCDTQSCSDCFWKFVNLKNWKNETHLNHGVCGYNLVMGGSITTHNQIITTNTVISACFPFFIFLNYLVFLS